MKKTLTLIITKNTYNHNENHNGNNNNDGNEKGNSKIIIIMMMNYLSTFLMTASFVSLCMLFSAFTRSQLIALALGFTSILALWFLSGIAEMASGNVKEILSFASVLSHTESLNKGLLQLKDIVYFISFIAFFLFATQQRIEAYRWQ